MDKQLEEQTSNKYKKLNKIEFTQRPNVYITQELLAKIWYLCNQIHDVEWSGVLFYKTEGDLSDISNLKFTCTDFYLMDKGTGAYTEYESDDSVLMFKMKNKYLPPVYKAGKLHSHNNMKVFHSGTDLEDLYEYSEGEMYYLSLIVNNKGEFDCKIAWWGKRKVENKGHYTYISDNGDVKQITIDNIQEDETCIFTANCNVIPEIPSEFKERTASVIKDSEIKKVKNNTYSSLSSFVTNTDYKTKQTKLKFTDYGSDFDFDKIENSYNAFTNPNSVVNINKKLVDFIKTWIYGSDQNLEPSLQECLSTLEVTLKELNSEQVDEVYDMLIGEFELVADDVFGAKFDNYNLLAQKVKAELESYYTEFPELITDLIQAVDLIIDPEESELKKII
jgi:proteasome lid subunit RPN8/RPN11